MDSVTLARSPIQDRPFWQAFRAPLITPVLRGARRPAILADPAPIWRASGRFVAMRRYPWWEAPVQVRAPLLPFALPTDSLAERANSMDLCLSSAVFFATSALSCSMRKIS